MMEAYIKAVGNKINHLEKGNLSIKMDRYTMVIGSMTK
jgi:hypothetical protein